MRHRPGNPSAIHKTSFFDHMVAKLGDMVWNAAWRDNRRMDRFRKRERKHTTYFHAGLNGSRAVARRLRQIARNQLSPVFHKIDGREISVGGRIELVAAE